jgi:hypothetical protein
VKKQKVIVVNVPKRKTPTKQVLLEVLLSALNCESHFEKPTIINNDPLYSMDGAQVICDQCVKRIREALDLKDDEGAPCSFQYFGPMGE